MTFTWSDSGFAGIFEPILPVVRGTGYPTTPTTAFLSEVEVGNRLAVVVGGTPYSDIVVSITDDGSLEVSHGSGDPLLPMIRENYDYISYTIEESYQTPYYAGIEAALDALKLGTISKKSMKLWGQRRDDTHRWAYAKCVGLKPVEKYSNPRLVLPVEIEFHLREGLWYAETASQHIVTNEPSPHTFTLTNNGDQPALVKATLANTTGPGIGGQIALPKLENLTNGYQWTFDRAGTSYDVDKMKTMIVDAAAYSVVYDGAGNYASLTWPATQNVFMRLEPGANNMRFTYSIVESGTYTLTLDWYDTYL